MIDRQVLRMSCWVAPSLAAELWRIPLDQVMQLIHDGKLASREDQGFTFVDVAPATKYQSPAMLRPEERPTTFTAVDDESTIDDQPDTTQSETLGDWRAARMKASRTRVPPRRIPA